MALHTWLLSALTAAVERSQRVGSPVDELAPALEYLGHLWYPGAHVAAPLRHLWDPLESRTPQLSREWRTQVERLRDAIALLTLRAQSEARTRGIDW